MSGNRQNGFSNPIPIQNGGTNATNAPDARTNLGITIGARTIIGTADQILVQNGSGALGNPQISIQQDAILPGNGSVTVPRGTTIQQPGTPVEGMIRANTDTGSIEMYGDGVWFNPDGVQFQNLIFVAKGGDDANAGDRLNAPKITVQAAIDAVSTGGMVWVLDAGQYVENLTIDKGLQLWAPNAEFDGTGSGDLITVTGGGTTVVRMNIGDVNQGGPGLALNIPDPGTVVFLNAGIFFGSLDCQGDLIISDVAQIVSTIHIFPTGLLAIDITNALGCTFIFDAGSTVVGTIQEVIGPGNTTNTVYGGQLFKDLVQISNGFVVTSLDTTLDFTNLGSAAQVPVITFMSTTAQYQINGITMNGFGTNFSGGDRDLDITDGTSVWTTIPAASLQALVNARWGTADVPFPISIPLNQKSVAGSNVYATYSGGTTDYTAGSFDITLVYERVI